MNVSQRRRISVLCSHLQPRTFITPDSSPILSIPNCSSKSSNNDCPSNDSTNNSILQKDCIFCQIVQGQSPAFKLFEDDVCLCILDTNPLSHGHSLIIPKLHCCTLDSTPPSVIAAMCSKIPFISNAIMKVTGCEEMATHGGGSTRIRWSKEEDVLLIPSTFWSTTVLLQARSYSILIST